MKNSSVWVERGNQYAVTPSDFITKDKLPVGTYLLCFDQDNGYFLKRTGNKFVMDFKIYDMETVFMDHVIKTFENTDRNLGIMLTGVKGTGKTVTAKLLANRMNLPTILITMPFPGLADYIGSIKDECCFIFDEFEKTFKNQNGEDISGELLSVMDGVFTGYGRKVFILTTNVNSVDPNFISRPSRIRYIKEFDSLEEATIRAYCNDMLKYPEFFGGIIKYAKNAKIMTMDILKSIVEEVNIHKCDINDIDVFNVEEAGFLCVNTQVVSQAVPGLTFNEVQKYINVKEALQALNTLSLYSTSDEDIESDSLGKTINGLKIVARRGFRTYEIPYDITEMTVGEYFSGVYNLDGGYIIESYDPMTKIVVLYDDDNGRINYIRVMSCYANNSITENTYYPTNK